jgi:hypothetical protein
MSDLAYFAGFFDGEGTVSITPAPHHTLQVSVANTDGSVCLLFKDRFRGSVTTQQDGRRPEWKPCFHWTTRAQMAEDFVRAVLPWLVVKRVHAELALSFRETFHNGNILPRGSQAAANPERRAAVQRVRAECYAGMRQLNRRGPR